MIKSLYKDSITNISGRSGRSEDVYLRRGVKQGCPLSPLLFNICLDPLLKLINEENEEAGYKVEDNTFIVQAFADDVILVSGSRDGMSDIIKTCERFCNLTGMKIAPQKCQWISYMLKDGKRVSSSIPLRINNEDINSIDIDDCIIYLGAPIAFNKQVKMKKTREKISDIKMEIQKIVHSPLALTQIIDALKRLIAPKLDFALLNGVTPLKCIEKLDSFIRGQIQSLLDTNGLPIDYFYTHWRDGGLSLHSFKERALLLQIKTLCSIMHSKDESLENLIRINTDQEVKARGINRTQTKENNFFGYDLVNVENNRRTKTDVIFMRALKAARTLGLSIYRESDMDDRGTNNENNDKKEESLILRFQGKEEDVIVSKFDLLKTLNKELAKKHYEKLMTLKFHGHTFFDSLNSPISNYFISNTNDFIPDPVTKFVIKGRCNCLPTKELKAKGDSSIDPTCHNCNMGECDSLMHRLNGCGPCFNAYTKRHNEICKTLEEGIKCVYGNACPPINENSTVNWEGKEELQEEAKRLKPDLWFGMMDKNGKIVCPKGN